jgi:hypothetical protein
VPLAQHVVKYGYGSWAGVNVDGGIVSKCGRYGIAPWAIGWRLTTRLI